MADIPIKISELDKSYNLSASPVVFLLNQKNDDDVYETRGIELSTITAYAKNEIKQILSKFIEVGTIIPFAGDVLTQEHSGWLLCNGQQVLKSEYKDLWEKIGETYGTATESVFTLPNFKAKLNLGYCHIDDYFIPDFGNWPINEKIVLGEGNNPNFPDKGVFYYKLNNDEIRNHTHYIPNHTHKILNYENLIDYVYRKGKYRGAFVTGSDYWYTRGNKIYISPSINWAKIRTWGPTDNNLNQSINGGEPRVVISKNYNQILTYRNKIYKQAGKSTRNFLDKNPIKTIFTYDKNTIDEVKNRKSQPPAINDYYDSNTKDSSNLGEYGGDMYHNNIQPYLAMNYLIKY
jgi:microcystin-dependent protein